ncbi:MAG: Hsp20/alpha crystallin family protein [Bacilli bacterium]
MSKELGLFDPFANLFDFDRHFYFFNRDEKDMQPYDIIRKEDSIVITHNVLGIEKEDLKVTIKNENLKTYLVISGTSKDKVTGKTYSINSRLLFNPDEIDVSKAVSELKNGLLYITIPYKVKETPDESSVEIKIN